jgi:hypothetical protein
MPFSGTTFSEIDAARDEVKKIISGNKARLERAQAEPSAVATAMMVAGQEYGPIVDRSAALLATEPNNPAYIALNEFILKHLADFNAVSAKAAQLEALMNTV